jgi:peptidoglycan/LPS O-acetylase OafA/YrhL
MAYVDGLRAVAALWVLAYHAWNMGYRALYGDRYPALFVLGGGFLGVQMFLVLSGFCLTYPFLKRDTTTVELGPFAIRRAVRILPPYWICAAIIAVLTVAYERFVLSHGGNLPVTLEWTDVAKVFFLVQNFDFERFGAVFFMNAALWSVALECQLYCFFPALMRIVLRPVWLLAICGGIAVITWGYGAYLGAGRDHPLYHQLWLSPPSMIIVFALGMAVATWMRVPTARANVWANGGLALALAACAAAYSISGDFPPLAFTLMSLATVCFLRAGGDSWSGRLLAHPWLVKVGFISYTLYIIHSPLLTIGNTILDRFLSAEGRALAMFVIALLAIPTAFLVFPLLEKPFHTLAKRLTSKEPAKA